MNYTFLNEPGWQARLMQQSPKPGFLGLDLSDALAYSLLERFLTADAVGYRLPAAYRQPRLTQQEAYNIAEREIVRQQQSYFPGQVCSPISLTADQVVCWTFRALLPGHYFFVHVDKLDGHYWQKGELWALHAEEQAIIHKLLRTRAQVARLPMTRWHESYRTYDIRLRARCLTPSDLTDLFQEIPELRDEELQNFLLRGSPLTQEQVARYKDAPFLCLNLSYELAGRLAERLQTAGAWANRLPSEYRDPPVSRLQAEPLAQQAINEAKAKYVPNDTIGSVCADTRWPIWEPYWIFTAASPELLARGYIPGCLMVRVDKLDGHIWTDDALTLFELDGKA